MPKRYTINGKLIKYHTVPIRFREQQYKDLQELAKHVNSSISEVVRFLIDYDLKVWKSYQSKIVPIEEVLQ